MVGGLTLAAVLGMAAGLLTFRPAEAGWPLALGRTVRQFGPGLGQGHSRPIFQAVSRIAASGRQLQPMAQQEDGCCGGERPPVPQAVRHQRRRANRTNPGHGPRKPAMRHHGNRHHRSQRQQHGPTARKTASVLGEDTMAHPPFLNRVYNVLGGPALSVCNGFSAAGLPLSFHIGGRPFEDDLVLRVGDAVERIMGTRGRRPSLPEPVKAAAE